MTDKFYEWTSDMSDAVNKSIEQLTQEANVEDPIITYSDDWKHKSNEERRRWAFERVFRGDMPIRGSIDAAEEVISWINGGVSPPSEQPREVA